MTNTHSSRVPFTYQSLLYKLDNIHLKQTYQGKPYSYRRIRSTEAILVNSLDDRVHQSTITANRVKTVYSENEISQHLFQHNIGNSFIDTSGCLPNNKLDGDILHDYVDDSDAASDLSIDGADVNSSSVYGHSQAGNFLPLEIPIYSRDGLTNQPTGSQSSEISNGWKNNPNDYKEKLTSLNLNNDNEGDTREPDEASIDPINVGIQALPIKDAMVTTPDVQYTTKKDISSDNQLELDSIIDRTYENATKNENVSKSLHSVQSDAIDKLLETHNSGNVAIDKPPSLKSEGLSMQTSEPLDGVLPFGAPTLMNSDCLNMDTSNQLKKPEYKNANSETPMTLDKTLDDFEFLNTKTSQEKYDVHNGNPSITFDRPDALTMDATTKVGTSNVQSTETSTALGKSDIDEIQSDDININTMKEKESVVISNDIKTPLENFHVQTRDAVSSLEKSDVHINNYDVRAEVSSRPLDKSDAHTKISNIQTEDSHRSMTKTDVRTKDSPTPIDHSDDRPEDISITLGTSGLFIKDPSTYHDKSNSKVEYKGKLNQYDAKYQDTGVNLNNSPNYMANKGNTVCVEMSENKDRESILGDRSKLLKQTNNGTRSFRLRQTDKFVKEFDNSFSLISDLLLIGSSSKTARNTHQALSKTFNSNSNICEQSKKGEVVGQKNDFENTTLHHRTKSNKENENHTTTNGQIILDNIPKFKNYEHVVDKEIDKVKPQINHSSSFPKLHKSAETSTEVLSESVDKEYLTNPRIDWSSYEIHSSITSEDTQKIKSLPLTSRSESDNEDSSDSSSHIPHILKRDESNVNNKKDAGNQENGKINPTVFHNDIPDMAKSTEGNQLTRSTEFKVEFTGNVRIRYDSNTTDTSLVMNNSVEDVPQREEIVKSAENIEDKSDRQTDDVPESPIEQQSSIFLKSGHIHDDNEDIVSSTMKFENSDKAENKSRNCEIENDKTAESTGTTSGDNTIPITIKRLARPEKSKSKKNVNPKDKEQDPFSSLQFVFSDKTGMSGYDKSDYPTQKMLAETIANMPLLSGKTTEFCCPTCGEQVLNTGKRETDCLDPVHRMLMKIPSLQSIADEYNLTVRNIAGDGNCMFSAVIDQLKIAGDFRFTKDSLRSTAVDYLREHPLQEDGSHLEDFLSKESWQEYLTRMNRDGEWGDHMVLNGITEVIGRHVTVLSTSGNAVHLVPRNTMPADDQTFDSVYLGHVGGMHYVSLRPKDWEDVWPINARIRRLRQYSGDADDVTRVYPKTVDAVCTETGHELQKDVSANGMSGLEKIVLNKGFQYSSCEKDIPECMDTDIHFVDSISRIPMIHLSFILNLLLPIEYFTRPLSNSLTPAKGEKMELEAVGSGSEKMNTSLTNFTKSGRAKLAEGLKNSGYLKQVAFPLASCYKVLQCEPVTPEVTHGQVLTMVVDIAESHAGYLRLTTNMCSCCQKFMGISKYVNGKWYVSDLQISIKLPNPDNMKNHEYLKGVKFFDWPDQAREWVFRVRQVQWPRNEVINKIRKNGCYIVHRSHPCSMEKEIEFQFLFSPAEKLLIQEEMNEDMKYCFYVFKALVDFQSKNLDCKLSTYHLKTTLFYTCESISSDTWHSNLGWSIMFMVDLLLKWIRNRNLPNYFIKSNNMIDHWKRTDLDKLCEKIETLRLFPCMVLHFLSEEHGLTHSWLIDSVMASSKKFKEDGNVHSVIENTFNPTTFFFANYSLTTWRDYQHVLSILNDAFEKNLIWSGQSINFRDFIDEFLLTVNGMKAKRAFTEFIDEELNTQQDIKRKEAQSYDDFLGPDYKGKYGKRVLKSSVDPWKSINAFLSSLLMKCECEEVVNIARCLIDKCKRDLNGCVVDISEIDDEELKKQVTKSNNDVTAKTVIRQMSYYNLLCICYRYMNKAELALDFMYEYEEAVEKMPSKSYLLDICEMWRLLECPERVEEIKKKISNLPDDDDESFVKNVFSVLLPLT